MSNKAIDNVGIAGFTMYVNLEEITYYDNVITDTTLEDGSIVQEHVTNKPIILVLSGLVSNVKLGRNPVIKSFVESNKYLGEVKLLLPNHTQAQQNLINSKLIDLSKYYFKAKRTFDYYQQSMDFFLPSVKPVNLFIEKMIEIYKSKKVINIETTHKTFTNMVFETFSYTSTNEKDGLEYKIRAKQITFVKNSTLPAGCPAEAISAQTDNPVSMDGQLAEYAV